MTEKSLITIPNFLSRQSCTMVYVNLLIQQTALELFFCLMQPEDYKIPRCQLLDYKEAISNRI